MSRTIRAATADDLPAIAAIYNHYVATSTCTFQYDPDTDADRREWFAGRTAAHPVVVAEEGGEVVGWAALSPWKSRIGYAHSVEFSVYVHPEHHRRGIGRELVVDLIDRARAAGHHTIIGGACTEHPASMALQESLGFVPVAHFRETGYKFGRWLDVVYFQLMLRPEDGA